MKRGRIWGILESLVASLSKAEVRELEDIEHLLEGTIAEVKPRRDFQKDLGERLSQQVSSVPVEVEGYPEPEKVDSIPSLVPSDFPILAAGVVGGLILILMGVRLMLYLRGRGRTPQS